MKPALSQTSMSLGQWPDKDDPSHSVLSSLDIRHPLPKESFTQMTIKLQSSDDQGSGRFGLDGYGGAIARLPEAASAAL